MFMGMESNITTKSNITCELSMDLTWQAINHCYLTPKSTPSLLITCLIAFLLAFGLEHLRLVQRKYDRKLVSKYAHSHTQKTKWDSARDGEGTYELLDQVDEKEDELRSEIEKEVRPVRRRVVLEQCLRGVIQMFVFGIGLVVMIVFMYGNMWIVLSTLGGIMVGFALFTKDLVVEGALHGHGTFGVQASMWIWGTIVSLWRRLSSIVSVPRHI